MQRGSWDVDVQIMSKDISQLVAKTCWLSEGCKETVAVRAASFLLYVLWISWALGWSFTLSQEAEPYVPGVKIRLQFVLMFWMWKWLSLGLRSIVKDLGGKVGLQIREQIMGKWFTSSAERLCVNLSSNLIVTYQASLHAGSARFEERAEIQNGIKVLLLCMEKCWRGRSCAQCSVELEGLVADRNLPQLIWK